MCLDQVRLSKTASLCPYMLTLSFFLFALPFRTRTGVAVPVIAVIHADRLNPCYVQREAYLTSTIDIRNGQLLAPSERSIS